MSRAPPLHAEHRGRGSPLVFWHGWGMNLRIFDTLRDALGAQWQTTAVDLPGHGRSGWDPDADACALAPTDAAGLSGLLATVPQGATLVGWSLGGQLALRAALYAPERVARLVLIGTTPRFTRSSDWEHGVDAELLTQMRERLRQDHRRTINEFLSLQVRGSRGAAAVLAALQRSLLEHGAARSAALEAGLRSLAGTDLRAQLAAIRVPALVIAGQYDRVTPPAAGVALAAALPRARYLECARAGHAPFLSHLEELLPVLRAFLDGEAAA